MSDLGIPLDIRKPAPLSTRSTPLRRIAILLIVGATIWFGLFAHFLPPFPFPEWLRGYGDRNLHIAAFVCLTFATCIGRRSATGTIMLVALAAIALEAVQIWLPNRSANMADLLASLAGVGVGGALAMAANAALRIRRRIHRELT